MTNNKKIKNTETQGAIPEKHFQGMIESTAGIPWVVNLDSSLFSYVGPQAEKILGYPAEQWYEDNFWVEHIHPDDRQSALDYCSEASKKGEDYNFEYRMIHRDGHSVWILDYVNIAVENGKPVRLQGFMFDVSNDKHTETAIKNIAASVSAPTGCDFYYQLVKHLADLFEADYAFIGLLDKNDPQIINTTAICAHGSFPENISYPLKDTPCTDILVKGTCCFPKGVQETYPLDKILTDTGADSYIGTPLFDSHDKPIGLLSVLDSKPMAISSQNTEILEIFATRASTEIERADTYQQLQSAQQKLALHVQQTPLGVIEWDVHFCVTDWNPAAEQIFGYTQQEAIGRSARDLVIPQQQHPHIDAIWQALLHNRGGTRNTNDNVKKDGSAINCEWYNTPLITDDGQVIGVASLVADITARVQTETELEEYRTHLEDLVDQRTTEMEATNQELESFSYSVSHDLRAPLRHIDGFSQALQEDYADKVDENGQALLSRIRSGTQRMGLLIDDLLKLSKASRGNIECEPLNLSSMAEDIFNKLQHYSPERKISIDIKPKIIAVADHRLMHVLLENIIGNAWKYTSKTDNASITFDVTKNEQGEPVFCLRDNGAGFDMEYAEKLFTAFKRLHSEKEFEGTGIGLATVQRIINRHGGKIWAESETGKGAAFYFSLGI